MAYAITPTHAGIRIVTDEAGEVASFRYDAFDEAWIVTADPNRFPTRASLPPVFEGRFNVAVSEFRGVFEMFGVALPRLSPDLLPSHQNKAA